MSINVLIAFYSRHGVTECLARAVAQGAAQGGAEARLRRAREIVAPEVMAQAAGWKESADGMNQRYEAPTADDAEWADAIIFGSPTRFGGACAELRAYTDSLGGLWARGRLYGKAGGVFTSTETRHGGNETTLLSMYPLMAHLGLIIVPLGYGDRKLYRAGTPYGASSIAGDVHAMPAEDDLDVARLLGRRVTEVAKALRAAAEHPDAATVHAPDHAPPVAPVSGPEKHESALDVALNQTFPASDPIAAAADSTVLSKGDRKR